MPAVPARREAARLAQLGGGSGNSGPIPHFVRLDFAHATQAVLYVMAGVMGVAGLVALRALPRGHRGDGAARAEREVPARQPYRSAG